MGAQGTATIDFGAFPGACDTSVAVAQPTILGTSLVEAWLYPVATADHSADEHQVMVGQLKVVAGAPVAGVGFTIYAYSPDNPGTGTEARYGSKGNQRNYDQKDGLRLYGQWTVAWVWN